MIVPSQLAVLANQAAMPRQPGPRLPRHRRTRDAGEVAIRTARRRDVAAVHELEALEGRILPAGEHLIAELGGVPVAAIALADGSVVADPFERTAAIVALLQVRARQLRIAGVPRPTPRLALIERLAR